MKNNIWQKIEQIFILENKPLSTFRVWYNVRKAVPPSARDWLLDASDKHNISLTHEELRHPNQSPPNHIPTKATSGHPEQSPEFLPPQTQETII